jgi:hypothetical protein
MPTLSASDYTQYLKFKAAAQSGIRPAIQTRDNVTVNQSVLNANILTSQASLVVSPTVTALRGNARIQAVQPSKSNRTEAFSTIAWGSGQGPTTTASSKFQQPGGLPASGRVSTYTRLPQNAGWA